MKILTCEEIESIAQHSQRECFAGTERDKYFAHAIEQKIIEKIGEPVAYVEGIPNLDGERCNIDHWLPAGTALYIIDFEEEA